MTVLAINDFRGEIPRIDKKKLPEQAATEAENVRIDSGNLETWQDALVLPDTMIGGVVNSIYLYDSQYWFSSNEFFSVVDSPLPNDPYQRAYFTEHPNGQPRVTSNLIAGGAGVLPLQTYDLGVIAPATAPSGTVNVDGGADPQDTSDDETRFYVVTYVTDYGEEGPPSPVSAELSLGSPSTEDVDLVLPVLGANTRNITKKRIYRTSTSGNGTVYLFVAEVLDAVVNYNDSLLGSQLGEQLSTTGFNLPPAGMNGLVMGTNGIMAGFVGNELVFSEAYLPYAYPLEYRRTLQYEIVAIAPTATGFVVGTKGLPYIITGVSPDSLSMTKVDVRQSCVSHRSMVDMGDIVIYASPDGLVAVNESNAKLITEDLFSKREWRGIAPYTIHAYFYEGRYIFFYGDLIEDGNGVGGIMFNPLTKDITRLDFYATSGYNDIENDALYLVIGGVLTEFDSGAGLLNYRWKSKVFRGDDITFSCAKVFTDDAPNVSAKIWADGLLIVDLDPITDESFRLPPVRATEWQVELRGAASIERFAFATSLSELE